MIEDDDAIRANVVELLSEEGFEAIGAENGARGIEVARVKRPDLIVCDLRMPEMDGFKVLEALRADEATRGTPFIFLSAAADRADVRAGMNLGADDYVTKPFSRAELLAAVRSRLERREVLASLAAAGAAPRPSRAPRWEAARTDSVVVADPAMRAVYDEAAKAAMAPISVLILGETGVGKEVLAHGIHRMSQRRDAPFLALNCAALSESLLESELFGNERGAFTGAVAARPGLFESADKGTVFLDELGELPMMIQVKLLRVLEERRVMRVGGRTPISVDVRFIAATNRDLEAEVARGSFRQDLYYRLAGIVLTIPPLRERPTEIVELALRFARSSARKLERPEPRFTEAAKTALAGYAWPGNVRELRNVVDRAVVLAPGHEIDLTHLPPKIAGLTGRESSPAIREVSHGRASEPELELGPPSSKLRAEMGELERRRIVEALERCGGNQTAAAELLGISRRTLVTRLGAYELPRPRKRT